MFFQTYVTIDISLDSSKELEHTMQFLKYFFFIIRKGFLGLYLLQLMIQYAQMYLSDLLLKYCLDMFHSPTLPAPLELLILFTDSESIFLLYFNFFSASSHCIQSVRNFLSSVFVSRGLAHEGMMREFSASSFFIVVLVANL